MVFRTADGGALVLGRLHFNFDGTPKSEGDKLTIGDDAAALAGGKETTTGMVLNFAESMAVYVPPAGSNGPDEARGRHPRTRRSQLQVNGSRQGRATAARAGASTSAGLRGAEWLEWKA